jgi:TolB-like protein
MPNLISSSIIYFLFILLIGLSYPSSQAAQSTQKPSFQSQEKPGVKAEEQKKQKLIKRSVLLLDFVNRTNAPDVEYLVSSIPEAFIEPLEKTNSFELINRDKGAEITRDLEIKKSDLFIDNNAVIIGKDAEADIVVIGNFIRMENKILIQSKAIDVSTGRVRVSRSEQSKLDTSLFNKIDQLTKNMSEDMRKNIPMITEKAAIQQQLKGTFSRTAGAILLSNNIGLGGTSSKYLASGFGIKAQYSRQIFDLIFHPIAQAGFNYSSGKGDVKDMTSVFVNAGMLLPMKLKKDVTVGFYISGGMNKGSVDRREGYPFLLPAFDAGLLADYLVWKNWSITMSAGIYYILDENTSLLFGNLYLGAGRHFK